MRAPRLRLETTWLVVGDLLVCASAGRLGVALVPARGLVQGALGPDTALPTYFAGHFAYHRSPCRGLDGVLVR